MTTDPTADRTALIAGLRGLASFLEANPAVPVRPAYHEIPVMYFPDGDTDDERRAAVDAIASALGATASDPDGYGHYKTERAFGPVVYGALAISDERRALHEAGSSYYHAVTLDDGQAVAA